MYGIVRKPLGLREAMGASSKPALRIPVVRGGHSQGKEGDWERWKAGKFQSIGSSAYNAHGGVLRLNDAVVDNDPSDAELHAPKDCTELPETDGTVEFYWKDEEKRVCGTCRHRLVASDEDPCLECGYQTGAYRNWEPPQPIKEE